MKNLASTIIPQPIENKRFTKDLFTKLLPIFMRETLDGFSSFQMAYDAKNSEDAVLILHKISGVAKSYGANLLVSAIKEVEHNITNGRFLESDMESLQTSLTDIFKFIKEEYDLLLD